MVVPVVATGAAAESLGVVAGVVVVVAQLADQLSDEAHRVPHVAATPAL